MRNKIRIILVVFLFISALLTACNNEIERQNTDKTIAKKEPISSAEVENNQPQEDDIRTVDEVGLVNLSQEEQVLKYKVGDTFLGLTVTELEYEQMYSNEEWVDNYISVKFEGNMNIWGNLFILNGNIEDINSMKICLRTFQ